ncbi:MAG: RnfABCDGE type electron transport complex subunit G [Synergistaceae bacterium]|jgi:electron transport complex protein RnfG|nr:RnfABCDGE type electron transport complex subunit G [Synergistaceae bacterium]
MPQSNAKNAQKIISLGVTLFIITVVTGLILGVVHDVTLEPIRLTQERLKAEALRGVLPDAEEFRTVEKVQKTEDAGPIVIDVQQALAGGKTLGYCLTVASRGYGGTIELAAGITNDGKLRGIRILNHSETPGLGAKSEEKDFYEQFRDSDKVTVVKREPAAPGEIMAISGATITSTAVADGVNAALEYWRGYLAEGE